MDHYSILDRSSAPPVAPKDMPGTIASRSATASVSAGIAAANAHLPRLSEPGPRLPGEDGGHSLAEMAYLDLDAALQLLAERAQYITAASGAAIALRRGENNDMLCRASAGSNAPELGALLSMEYGLSGECVRTRQVLRCDDAERDSRVNREVCRDLGIASVVVMPIVSDEQVLGVFELLSGKPRAFEERDLSALQRLSEMVETAVKHAAAAAQAMAIEELELAELLLAESEPSVDVILAEAAQLEVPRLEVPQSELPQLDLPAAPALDLASAPPTPSPEVPPAREVLPPRKEEAEAAPKRPLFWSAAMRAQAGTTQPAAESIAVPPVLRNLQKCQACGFPVSQGRTFCVECEEKQWRDQRPLQPAAAAVPLSQVAQKEKEDEARQDRPSGSRTPDPPEIAASKNSSSAQTSPSQAVAETSTQTPAQASAQIWAKTVEPAIVEPADPELASPAPAPVTATGLPETDLPEKVPEDAPASDNSTLFLSSAQPSESWFAANKYILGALLVVAIVIGAIAWLR